MSDLLVEIGNTALKAAWSEGTTLGKISRYQGEKKIRYITSVTEKEKPGVLLLSSSQILAEDERDILSRECSSLLVLDPSNTSILQKYGLPEYLPFDRAAEIIAAKYLFKGKNITIFDFGTTLTVDFTDAEGKYLGGNISPGFRTRFISLNRYSKSLPLVDTPSETSAIGSSIKESIESGVVSGIMFEIEGYIASHPENIVIFTGGDSNYFAKRMKNSIFVISNLVLMGLALIKDDYVRKNLQ